MSAPAGARSPRSIGERLRAGRERAGLSVAAAAEKLHLDPKVIEALEADRFAELGALGVRARPPAPLCRFRRRAGRGAGRAATRRATRGRRRRISRRCRRRRGARIRAGS